MIGDALQIFLYKVPVLFSEYTPIRRYIMTEFSSTSNIEICKLYYTNAITHNETIINNINNMIVKNYIYINHSKIILNENIINYFKIIIKNLDDINKSLSSIHITDIEKYRQDLSINKAKDLINIINDEYILYDNIYYLFPLKKLRTDIIFTKKKSLGQYLLTLANFTGGQKDNDEINYDKPFYNVDYSNYNDYLIELLDEDEGDGIKYAFYYNLKKLNVNTDNENKREAENLYNLMFNYYNFTGCTITKCNFIKSIIDEYNKTHLKYMTLDNYIKLFKTWYNEEKSEYDKNFDEIFHDYNVPLDKFIKTRKRNMNNRKYYNRRNNTKKLKTILAK